MVLPIKTEFQTQATLCNKKYVTFEMARLARNTYISIKLNNFCTETFKNFVENMKFKIFSSTG